MFEIHSFFRVGRRAWLLRFCYAYAFSISLGSLARLSFGGASFGLSSPFLLAIVGVWTATGMQGLKNSRLLALWLALCAYIAGVMIADGQTPVSGDWFAFDNWQFTKLASLVCYTLFAAAAASLDWGRTEVLALARAVFGGLLIAAVFSTIDMVGWVDLPRINEIPLEVSTQVFPLAHFGHRSLMAIYLSVLLTFVFIAAENPAETLVFRVCGTLIAGFFFYFLVWSRNRSGPAAIVVALGAYYLFNRQRPGRWLGRRVPNFAVAITVSLSILFYSQPMFMDLYLYTWISSPIVQKAMPQWVWDDIAKKPSGKRPIIIDGRRIYSLQEMIEESPEYMERIQTSDLQRWKLTKEVLANLNDHPWGKGFVKDAHVIFVFDIINAAGWIGVSFLAAIAWYFFRLLREIARRADDDNSGWALVATMVAWFLSGAMYNSLFMGIAWMMVGILVGMGRTGEAMARPLPATEAALPDNARTGN